MSGVDFVLHCCVQLYFGLAGLLTHLVAVISNQQPVNISAGVSRSVAGLSKDLGGNEGVTTGGIDGTGTVGGTRHGRDSRHGRSLEEDKEQKVRYGGAAALVLS